MSGGLSLLTTDVPLLLMGPEPQRVGTVPLTQGATHLDLSPEVLSQFWSELSRWLPTNTSSRHATSRFPVTGPEVTR